MLHDNHTFFSWGNPSSKDRPANLMYSMPIPASAYNSDALRPQTNQRTPIPSTRPIPLKDSSLWNSDLFGGVVAKVALEPEPLLQKQLLASSKAELQPNPKTAMKTPVPKPYVVSEVMKEFKAGDKADKPVEEKDDIDYLAFAKDQRKEAEDESQIRQGQRMLWTMRRPWLPPRLGRHGRPD